MPPSTPKRQRKRTKPAFRLMIGDAEYRAIGLVAAQWAYLEIQFDLCLYLVLAQPGVEKIRPPRVPQSFKARSDLLRDAARIVWAEHPDIRDRLIQIVNDATSLRTHRDRVIHGEWSLHRIGGRLGTKIRSITWRPAFKREEIPLDAEDVEEIADKISPDYPLDAGRGRGMFTAATTYVPSSRPAPDPPSARPDWMPAPQRSQHSSVSGGLALGRGSHVSPHRTVWDNMG